ncbi:PREDICTED: uncharacterized protein LOC102811403 [Chrysochloris asiatica]|uniref:Uncharacterized protein LOC102811403 n=1 Tax=Chrysochloris asiatica TaxID=185453 RepID=A0A9B0TPQ8_CHRAS|nr:PREDICTED: uncharacterized protein LOC102811403 [Chrysochloris asiatica]
MPKLVAREAKHDQAPGGPRHCCRSYIWISSQTVVSQRDDSTFSMIQDFKTKLFRAEANVDNQNSDLVLETSEDLFLTSRNLNVPLIRKPSISQRIVNTSVPIKSSFSPPLLTSARPSEQIVTEQHTILNQLTTFHMYSQSSYTHAIGHIVNFVTTKLLLLSTSSLSYSYLGQMVKPWTLNWGNPRFITIANVKNVGKPCGKAVANGILHMHNIKRTRVSFCVGDHTNLAEIGSTDHRPRITCVKVDELVLCLFSSNAMNSKMAFVIIDQVEMLTCLLNADDIHEPSKCFSLLFNRICKGVSESIQEGTPKEKVLSLNVFSTIIDR